MSKKTMIEVSDVTMQFRLNNDKILSLKEFVTTALRGKLQYNKFTALEHISFELKRGQTPVSYTHLDVYKRQVPREAMGAMSPLEELAYLKARNAYPVTLCAP